MLLETLGGFMVRRAVVDRDLGYNRILKDLADLNHAEILVGFQAGDVTELEIRGDQRKEPGISMAQIAAYNEFGTDSIPERSFMRTAFDENIRQINAFIAEQYGLIIDGKETLDRAANLIGLAMTGLIQRKIREIRYPPNAPSTIAQKGSSKPLIDFGQMINSVRHVVRR